MSMVRLQCPACSAIVRIGADTVAKHPVVRCAKCQGLVPVASSRLPDEVPIIQPDPEQQEKYSYKPKRKKRPASSFPVAWVVGGVVGLLVLVGVGLGVYFLIDAFSTSSPEKIMKQVIGKMEEMATLVEGIKSPGDVEHGLTRLMALKKEADELIQKGRSSNPKVDLETSMKLMAEFQPKMLDIQKRMMAAMMKLATQPELARAMQEHAQKLVGLGQGIGLPDLNMPALSSNTPSLPDNFDKPPPPPSSYSKPNDVKQQQLETELIAKASLLSQIPGYLSEIRDAQSAEHALSVVDSLVESISAKDGRIKELERENVRPASALSLKTVGEIQQHTAEIAVHMARIGKIINIDVPFAKLSRKLSQGGVYQPDPTVASEGARTNPPANDTNPFEPSKPAPPRNDTATNPPANRPEESNPFKPSTSSPSAPGATPERSVTLSHIIDRMTGGDWVKKRDALKELQTTKVEEAGRKDVLEALLNLCPDRDIHDKIDILNAYKKWASTQEQKEQLGQHAEVFLKDHWSKKDALRYFGENKVITAAKEVARLLKDNFDQKDAAETLIAMGSEAEKAVIPHLTDLEPKVRYASIEVLARIGTREVSMPEVQKLFNDRFVGKAAKEAAKIIGNRKK